MDDFQCINIEVTAYKKSSMEALSVQSKGKQIKYLHLSYLINVETEGN